MIREAQRSELPAILELWLESTTWGHPFIKANYWRDCIPLVRDAYLANAQNWVWEEDGKLLGFVQHYGRPISGSDVCRTEGRQARYW